MLSARQSLLIALLAAFAPCTGAAATDKADPTDRCDRLAAGPDDPHRQADPVELGRIDVPAALAMCESALARDPENPRLHYQYGRALLAAGREDDARRSWRRAAVFDYEAALYELGRTLLVPGNTLPGIRAREGQELLFRAAGRGHIGAAETLGQVYEKGHGVPPSAVAAARWYGVAVAGGSVLAMQRLGVMYMDGRGVEQNPRRAIELFETAAAVGDTRSMNALGWIYEKGTGVEADAAEALLWYRKAAELGWTPAQVSLARLLLKEDGRDANREAFTWLTIAELLGDEPAANEASALVGRLSAEEKRKAEEAAHAWVDEFQARMR